MYHIALMLLTAIPSLATGQEKRPISLPPGALKLPVTRDTWFSNYGKEIDGNSGGAERLKVKSYQEMSLLDFDLSSLRGRVVRSATLHLHSTGDPRLKRVTVSTFAAEWVEGTATDYTPQEGSSTFNRRRHPDVFWAEPGSDLCSVMLGAGGTIWRMADASPPDADEWQTVAVDPVVVAARVAGISQGFVIFDDTGSEWKRDGEKFRILLFPNRFAHSRESGPDTAPYLVIVPGEKDEQPPPAPADLASDAGGLPAGESWITWTTPRDVGGAGTVGFLVTVNGTAVPRYLIPIAGASGAPVRMHLRDLHLEAGSEVVVGVRAVDGAGNISPVVEKRAVVSKRKVPSLPGKSPQPFTEPAELPKLGRASVAVIDELDKVQPLSGAMIPPQPVGYLAANHLWSAADKVIRLHAARNEFVSFQVLLGGQVRGLRADLAFEKAGNASLSGQISYYLHVKSKNGPLPDPIVPLDGSIDMAANTSLHCEVYVPHLAATGLNRGRLTLRAGRERLGLDIDLYVWDFTLPDCLSFLPEMNCYDLPPNEMDFYRLAHFHRTVLNRVPYTQAGRVSDGCAPAYVPGDTFDWRAWDARFGPLLSGAAFADLPRKGVPIECFYLPLHENWPTPMEGNYNGSYWADQAFPLRYRNGFARVSRQFADHFAERGWNDTLFHCFLNGKNNFKVGGWSRGSSPWLLDEPANFQDFWALRFFAAAFHDGVKHAQPGPKMLFRADISRPEWQRDSLDGLLDYNVVGGAFRRYHRLVLDRRQAFREIVIEYGSSNAIEDSNVQALGWCIDAWTLGANGVVPWQSVGSSDSWKEADATALFYPGANDKGVMPSVRLKAYRRGQQDVEYLTLLARHMKEPRWALGRAVQAALKLTAKQQDGGSGAAEDAGVMTYPQLRPQDAWALRIRVGEVLSKAAPAPARRLVDLYTPRRDPARMPDRGVTGAAGTRVKWPD